MDGFLGHADPGLIVLGVDPGLTGALAIVDENDVCYSIPMPVVDHVVDGGAIAEWLGQRHFNLAVVERAQAFPGQGVSSAFNYGASYGKVLGVLEAGAYPYRLVSPASWKRAMRLSKDKEQSRRRAIELLPMAASQFRLKKDEARAEAALIAWWYLHERNRSEDKKTALQFPEGRS